MTPTRDELRTMALRQLARARQFVTDACDSEHDRELILILDAYLAEHPASESERVNADIDGLIERLRESPSLGFVSGSYQELQTLCSEAADELARLRDENANLQRENIRINAIIDQQAERFEVLEAEIEKWRRLHGADDPEDSIRQDACGKEARLLDARLQTIQDQQRQITHYQAQLRHYQAQLRGETTRGF